MANQLRREALPTQQHHFIGHIGEPCKVLQKIMRCVSGLFACLPVHRSSGAQFDVIVIAIVMCPTKVFFIIKLFRVCVCVREFVYMSGI